MTDSVVEGLVKRIQERKVVVVCGAGVSRAATNNKAPGWWQLIGSGIEAARVHAGGKWAEAQKAQLETGDLSCWLAAADQVRRKLQQAPGGLLTEWLRLNIGDLRVEERHSEILAAIKSLDCPTATTNYDDILCDFFERHRLLWNRPEQEVIPFLNRVPGRDGIFHLHGHWQDPDTMIFGQSDYDRIGRDGKAQFLQKLLAFNHSVLFIGCSHSGLTDDMLAAY